MKYKIKQHIGFKFRYPVHLTEDDIGKNKANGRCDRTDKVSVNVLVMAKDKKKNKDNGTTPEITVDDNEVEM